MLKWFIILITIHLIIGAYDLKSGIYCVLSSLIMFSFGAILGTVVKNIKKEMENDNGD